MRARGRVGAIIAGGKIEGEKDGKKKKGTNERESGNSQRFHHPTKN